MGRGTMTDGRWVRLSSLIARARIGEAAQKPTDRTKLYPSGGTFVARKVFSPE